MGKGRVVVGISGGVDSAVTAAMLLAQGYEVTGVFMVCYQGPGCRSDEDRKDALDVALRLNMPFEVLDFRKAYQEKVLEYFYKEYEAGRTPNPDVVCNREIKFGMFYEWAMEKGYDFVATGHYARIEKVLSSRFYGQGNRMVNRAPSTSHLALLRGKDEAKDQSYFLYQLKAEQLPHILFPIGGMTKQEVREKARKLHLPVAEKPDSQGICFIGEVRVRHFLQDKISHQPGEVRDKTGNVIGAHNGVGFLTIGQRHGFTVKVKDANTPPLYVIDKDREKNVLVVGTREDCMRERFEVEKVHWIDSRFPTQDSGLTQVRIRHLGELIDSRLTIHDSRIHVKLEKPVFGVAPGQAAVFYRDGVCLGGGVIV